MMTQINPKDPQYDLTRFDAYAQVAFKNLLTWFRKKQIPGDMNERAKLQDCIARRTNPDLRAFAEMLTPEDRRMLQWFIFNLLDSDTAERFFIETTGRLLLNDKLAVYREDIENQYAALERREDLCRAAEEKHAAFRKGYWKRLRDIEAALTIEKYHRKHLTDRFQDDQKEVRRLCLELKDAQARADKLEALAAAIRAVAL